MTLKRIDSTSWGKPTHYYMLDGVKADGVTTVLSKALPKPALVGWAAKSVAEFVADNQIEVTALYSEDRDRMVKELKGTPYRERDKAANRGTEVHALAEKLVKGEKVEVPGELAGYVEAYVSFLDEWKPQPVLVEAAVGNRRWKYAGTLDLVADLPNGERALLDLKTARGVYGEVGAQISAYRFAEVYLDGDGNERAMADLGITSSYVVHVRDGSYSVIPVESGEDTAYKFFLHLLWVSRRIDAMKDWLGDPAAPPFPGAPYSKEDS